MICFHFSIFEPLETANVYEFAHDNQLWFAFILVSLNHWKQRYALLLLSRLVVICFHFSIFEPLETANVYEFAHDNQLWFAFILVSLNHWKQRYALLLLSRLVVICFHFSIFEPLETASRRWCARTSLLWFAFILVSLNHWKQLDVEIMQVPPSCDLLSF